MLISQHTINSGIVIDILAELAKTPLDGKYVTGGISAQLFLPKEFHRVTSDIDLESSERLTTGDYHQFVNSFSQPLIDRGYDTSFEKQRITYDAVFSRDNFKAVLQAPKRSHKKFEELRSRLERESSNALIIDYAGGKLRVINPHDLIARKAGRADVFSREYNLDFDESMPAEEAIERANILKRDLDFTNIDPREFPRKVAYIRMLADVADIKAIAKNSPIDVKYITEAIRDYHTHDQKSLERFLSRVLEQST